MLLLMFFKLAKFFFNFSFCCFFLFLIFWEFLYSHSMKLFSILSCKNHTEWFFCAEKKLKNWVDTKSLNLISRRTCITILQSQILCSVTSQHWSDSLIHSSDFTAKAPQIIDCAQATGVTPEIFQGRRKKCQPLIFNCSLELFLIFFLFNM